MARSLRVAVLGLLLAGCSGSDSTPPLEPTGTVQFRIAWPAVAGRLVPDLARSLTVRVSRTPGELLGAETTSRPNGAGVATLTFQLPAGEPLTATANTYPHADGSGESLASAAIALNVLADRTLTIDITGETDRLRSTVDTFALAPDPARVEVGGELELVATARNGGGSVVLLPPLEFRVTAGADKLAPAGAAGWSTATFDGLAQGTATVEASVEQQAGDPTSRLVATIEVTVGPILPPPSSNGVLTGRVFDGAGVGLDGVSLSVVGSAATAESNLDGYFSLGELPAGELVVRAARDGYVRQTRPTTIVAGRNNRLVLQLRATGVTQAIDPSVDNTIVHAGGSVRLPAGALAGAGGRQAVGPVEVRLTVLKPSDAGYVGTFPGAFRGLPAAARQAGEVPLESFGVVDVAITSGGAELDLAPGAQAEVVWPIDPGADPGDAVVPIWTLDEATGVWREEGFAIRDAGHGVYRANVSHFSPWNLDRPFSALATKEVRLTVAGQPVPGVPVRVAGRGWAFDAATDELGRAAVNVPANEVADVLYLDHGNEWQVAETGETMPGPGQVLVNSFAFPSNSDLEPHRLAIILRWGPTPDDLDSNLMVPPFGSRVSPFRVWFAERGVLHVDPFAQLDTDDTTGHGPEIISVRRCLPGTYRYVVHKLTPSGTLEESQAEVTVITDGGQLYTFEPPTQNPTAGAYWAVFELDADAAGQVTAVRELGQYGGAELLGGG